MKIPGPHWRFVIETIVIAVVLLLFWWAAKQCPYSCATGEWP
jgi:hypothetical protein